MEKSDFVFFLLYDDNLAATPEGGQQSKKAGCKRTTISFEQIDREFKHGNIVDTLDKEYDKGFIEHLVISKKKGEPWYDGYTYAMVKASHDRLKKKQDNPSKSKMRASKYSPDSR